MMSARHSRKDPARTSDQFRPMLCIVRAPGAVCVIPALPRQPRSAINLIPVGGVVFFEFIESPRDAHFLEHCQICRSVGAVRIDECAVPVEENSFNVAFAFRKHCSRAAETRWRSNSVESGIDGAE